MLKIEKHKNDHSRLLTEQLMERDKPKKIGIGWANFAAVAMETQKGGKIVKFTQNYTKFRSNASCHIHI